MEPVNNFKPLPIKPAAPETKSVVLVEKKDVNLGFTVIPHDVFIDIIMNLVIFLLSYLLYSKVLKSLFVPKKAIAEKKLLIEELDNKINVLITEKTVLTNENGFLSEEISIMKEKKNG